MSDSIHFPWEKGSGNKKVRRKERKDQRCKVRSTSQALGGRTNIPITTPHLSSVFFYGEFKKDGEKSGGLLRVSTGV